MAYVILAGTVTVSKSDDEFGGREVVVNTLTDGS
jgi:hypothetical protein